MYRFEVYASDTTDWGFTGEVVHFVLAYRQEAGKKVFLLTWWNVPKIYIRKPKNLLEAPSVPDKVWGKKKYVKHSWQPTQECAEIENDLGWRIGLGSLFVCTTQFKQTSWHSAKNGFCWTLLSGYCTKHQSCLYAVSIPPSHPYPLGYNYFSDAKQKCPSPENKTQLIISVVLGLFSNNTQLALLVY